MGDQGFSPGIQLKMIVIDITAVQGEGIDGPSTDGTFGCCNICGGNRSHEAAVAGIDHPVKLTISIFVYEHYFLVCLTDTK